MDNKPSVKEPEVKNGRLLRWSKGILTAAGAILLYLLISLLVSFLYALICSMRGVTDPGEVRELVNNNASLLNMVVNVLVIMLLIAFSFTKRGKPTERLRIHTINPAKVIGFILFGICLNLFVSLAFSFIPFPDSLVEAQNEAYEAYYSNNILMALISVGVATGIAEELLFRSAVISPLKSAFGKIPALILSALVFCLFHVSLIAKIYSFILGLVLGLFFLKYDSVIPTIIIHISFNCTAFVTGILDNARREFLIIICVVSALMLARMFIWLYVRYPGFSDVLFDRGGRLRPVDPAGQILYDRIRELREREEEIERKELEELNEAWDDLHRKKKRHTVQEEIAEKRKEEPKVPENRTPHFSEQDPEDHQEKQEDEKDLSADRSDSKEGEDTHDETV
ncbi:MAG: CPBP family intramembrane metalloprotease [Clostridia bacterium]|nr:CPBP family intramembrane metalloprotease [Clostridia bacterium]